MRGAPLQNGGAKEELRGTPDLNHLEHCAAVSTRLQMAVTTRLQMAVTMEMAHVLCLQQPNQLFAGV